MDAAPHDSPRTCGVFVTIYVAFPAVVAATQQPPGPWGYVPRIPLPKPPAEEGCFEKSTRVRHTAS
jgi:hypothetical protein